MFSSYMVFMLHIYTCRLPKEYNFHIHLTSASTAAAAKSSAPSSAAWAEPSSAAAAAVEADHSRGRRHGYHQESPVGTRHAGVRHVAG